MANPLLTDIVVANPFLGPEGLNSNLCYLRVLRLFYGLLSQVGGLELSFNLLVL